MINLDKRLRAVLDEINCKTLADIGSDHGKISAGALLEKRAEKVYAVDISEASLLKTKRLAEELSLDNLVCLAGDGLLPVKDDIDMAVIAGLGGNEIIKILTDSGYRGRAVLVPHRDAGKLREYLSGKFNVEKDYFVECHKKFYPIIVVSEGSYTYKEDEISFGRNYPETEAYYKMLTEKRERLSRLIEEGAGGRLTEELEEVTELCLKSGI